MKFVIFFAFVLIVCSTFMSANADPFTDENGNPCPCVTTNELRYVCGSNGVTYSNPASLNCENKCKKTSVQIAHYGRC